MVIGARLHHMELLSGDVEACAAFYARNHDLVVTPDGARRICMSADCRLLIAPGPDGQLGFAAFAFGDEAALRAYRDNVTERTTVEPVDTPLFGADAFCVTDPDGNRVVFGHAADGEPVTSPTRDTRPQARLQHYAIRSAHLGAVAAFYRDVLGFVVSDQVQDEDGGLRACFFRTNAEHHALAIFLSSGQACLDHISFDTRDWGALRDWADHFASLGVPIVWGVGRHGPGNDVFFMVRDTDGNLMEVSAEMEVCAAGRPEGRWPHEERTLNLWGKAILRS